MKQKENLIKGSFHQRSLEKICMKLQRQTEIANACQRTHIARISDKKAGNTFRPEHQHIQDNN